MDNRSDNVRMIEQNINDYIAQINFKKDFDLQEIKQNIKQITGAIPSVQLDWTFSENINEATEEVSRVEKATSLNIVWLDVDNIPHRLNFII